MNIFPYRDIKESKQIKLLAPTAILMLALLVLSGCNKRYEAYPLEHVLLDETDRHPIRVKQNVQEMTLYVSDEEDGISVRQKNKLARFFASYRQRGHGEIEVSIPTREETKEAMLKASGEIKEIAGRQGIAPGYLNISLNRSPYRSSTVRVSYNYSIAKAPKCGEWHHNLGENYSNLHYHNFGCSQQRNLAAMVANPRDLIKPRGFSGNRSSERRDVIWEKHIKGETTVSERSSEEKGTVSEVAKE